MSRNDLQFKTVSFGQVKAAEGSEESRVIEAVASEEMIDRHGDVVLMSAIKAALPGYMKNPVILAGHQHVTETGASPVVGKCLEAVVKGKQFIIKVEFADTELGKEYYQLYKGKYQRAFSIGFRGKADWGQYEGERVQVIKELELFEISCVAVGANRGALSKSALRKLEFVNRKKINRGNPEYEELLEKAKGLLTMCGVDDEVQEAFLDHMDDDMVEVFTNDVEFRKVLIRTLVDKEDWWDQYDKYYHDDDEETEETPEEEPESELKKDIQAFTGEFNKSLGGVFSADRYLKYLWSDGAGSGFSEMEKAVFAVLKDKGLEAAREVFVKKLNPMKTAGTGVDYAGKFKK